MQDFNYFSEAEQINQQKFRSLRDRLFYSCARTLSRAYVTPNIITAASFLSLIPFVYFSTISFHPLLAVIYLVIHVILDGLDGVLARYTRTQNEGGAFLDMLNDHTGMIVVTGVLTFNDLLHPVLALTYTYAYTIMVLLVVLRNILHIPLPVVFRSKYLLYGVFAVWALASIDIVDIAVAVFTVLMVPFIAISIPAVVQTLGKVGK